MRKCVCDVPIPLAFSITAMEPCQLVDRTAWCNLREMWTKVEAVDCGLANSLPLAGQIRDAFKTAQLNLMEGLVAHGKHFMQELCLTLAEIVQAYEPDWHALLEAEGLQVSLESRMPTAETAGMSVVAKEAGAHVFDAKSAEYI